MAKAATVSKVSPSGLTAHIWSTSNYGTAKPDGLLEGAIENGKVIDPGLYIVAWCNVTGVPFARLFTVRRENGALTYVGGAPVERVTRWPPKSS